ncbi:MAG TPA: aminoglycoside phosphotransferase family protein, partial [Streptosporangiaceae bacterium]|nr:aminoglycoside phosphotransferase family protein [Streptosporangiaceae bacterium]
MTCPDRKDEAAVLPPGFLAAVLKLPVDDVSYERIGVGRGFASTVLRLTIQADGRPPLTAVAKVGPDKALEREAAFYRELADRLAGPAPQCWFAGPAPDGTPVVLLEDLNPARFGDALAGGSVEDVAAVLASMVPVWRHQAAGPVLGALPMWGSDPAVRQERFRVAWSDLREQLAGELPREIWLIGERLRDSLATVAAELRRRPGVVVHGDLHLDNVLFQPKGASRRPVVLDWGSVCAGPAAIDVFPFLAMSLSPEDHACHAADLLADLFLGSSPLDDGRRRLLCYFAGVIGWRNRPPGTHPREAALRTAALGDGRLVGALLQWDAATV